MQNVIFAYIVNCYRSKVIAARAHVCMDDSAVQ